MWSSQYHKVGEENKEDINEEVHKLTRTNFIIEVKYPSWLVNNVLVRKASKKLHMFVDFTDLNVACPKDPYPLRNIDRLIDESPSYKIRSFMDAYSSYN